MSILRDIRIGWKLAVCIAVLLSVCCVCGCTDDSSAGGDTATPAQTAAATAAPQSTPQASAPGEVVHYTALMAYLPTMTNNWITGEKEGATLTYGGESWSQVYADYTLKTDDTVVGYVYIQDTNSIEGAGYYEMWQGQMTLETPELKMYTGKVDGYPAYFIENREDGEYSEIVSINDRFFVYVTIENGKPEYLTVFNNQIDFDGIAGLA